MGVWSEREVKCKCKFYWSLTLLCNIHQVWSWRHVSSSKFIGQSIVWTTLSPNRKRHILDIQSPTHSFMKWSQLLFWVSLKHVQYKTTLSSTLTVLTVTLKGVAAVDVTSMAGVALSTGVPGMLRRRPVLSGGDSTNKHSRIHKWFIFSSQCGEYTDTLSEEVRTDFYLKWWLEFKGINSISISWH